jgi:phage FluMu protein Com
MILDDTHRCLECEKLLINQQVFVCEECKTVEYVTEWERKTIKDWREQQ